MTGSDVHVIVVSYNSAAQLPGFVESVRTAADAVSLRITVVDNASRDESVAVARALGVQCFRCDENRGYAGGINAGRHLDGDSSRALLVANPDVRFGASSVSMLFRQSIRHAAITVPRIVDAHGRVRPSLRREPTLRRAAGEALLGDHWPRRPGGLSIIVRDGERYRRAGWADWATGAALMIPAACDEAVGDWPEQYFLYSEETDYLHRARLAGFPVRYEPSASAFHAEGASGAVGLGGPRCDQSRAILPIPAQPFTVHRRRGPGPGRTVPAGARSLAPSSGRGGAAVGFAGCGNRPLPRRPTGVRAVAVEDSVFSGF